MRFINQKPGPALRIFLTLVPFVLVLIAYTIGSEIRLAANPQDKLLPSLGTIGETAQRLLTEGDRRSGRILFWYDTAISLRRFTESARRPSGCGRRTTTA